ncbi:MAG: alpha/beta fold hydrolase [Pseudomonadota bacterium]
MAESDALFARCRGTAFEAKHYASGQSAATALADYLERAFKDAGIKPPKFEVIPSADRRQSTVPAGQRIRLLEGKDKVRIASASVGEETHLPRVKTANWLNHLELDWDAPIWSPLFRELSRSHRVIRYDERGCGLSDWDVGTITVEDFVEDLEQVVDAANLDRFSLLGISQGAAVSIEYAARYPDRVSELILFGG